MSIEISQKTETRITDEAKRHGISIDDLLNRLMSERDSEPDTSGVEAIPDLPRLHLGAMGPLHRRDIYDDIR
jgi:hypothetical protein